MSDAKNIRKYIGVLNEDDGLLKKQSMTLALDTSQYNLYRFILQYVDPSKNFKTSDYGTDTLVMFYSEQEYERAKEELAKFGISFDEIGKVKSRNKEEENVNTVSPVPSKNRWWGKK